MTNITSKVVSHYNMQGIGNRILSALKDEGIDINSLTPNILTPIDQFHTRGIRATKDLANIVTPTASMHLLDVGCGIGGTARYLASTYGCQVTGIDLTNEYIEAASMLTELCHLDNLVNFRQANALNLPFNDNSFDMVWCQNVAMNIEDKNSLYREIARVIISEGYFISTEMSADKNSSPYFPLPWARSPEISFLISQKEMLTKLKNSGLKVIESKDTSLNAIKAFNTMVKTQPHNRLSLSLIAGEDIDVRVANVRKSLIERRIFNVTIAAKKQM